MTYTEPIISIDLHARNVEQGYTDSIRAVAETILRDEYAATGDARTWAMGAHMDIQACQHCDHYTESLDSTLDEGIEHLYQSTGLYAAADGISGMFFIAPEEFFSELEG